MGASRERQLASRAKHTMICEVYLTRKCVKKTMVGQVRYLDAVNCAMGTVVLESEWRRFGRSVAIIESCGEPEWTGYPTGNIPIGNTAIGNGPSREFLIHIKFDFIGTFQITRERQNGAARAATPRPEGHDVELRREAARGPVKAGSEQVGGRLRLGFTTCDDQSGTDEGGDESAEFHDVPPNEVPLAMFG